MEINEIKKRTLLLTQTDPKSDFVFQDWVDRGYCADIIFREEHKFIRALRRIWIIKGLPFQWIWYGKWKKRLNEYDTIILHMGSLCMELPKWIHKKFPNIRVICWYWNTVDEETLPSKISDSNIELWSFDFQDCKKYNMKKNVQYYCEPKEIEKGYEKVDIYFVGHDKGRRKQIEFIRDVAEQQDIICDFQIVKNRNFVIPYREIQKAIMKSKAVLEINKEGQSGYTLRTMESLFFDKKLITNNKSILDAPFYRENNIFYITEDNLKNLRAFLELPYDKTVDVYKAQYKIDTWFLNFFDKKEEE